MSACSSLRKSVRPYRTIRFPLDKFWWNFVFDHFSKICRENSSFIKIRQGCCVLFIKTCVYLWYYLANFFLVTKISNKRRKNQNTHFMFDNFFLESCLLWDNVEIYCRDREVTDDNIIRCMRFACWITKATHTHTEYVKLTAVPRQWRSRECASNLASSEILTKPLNVLYGKDKELFNFLRLMDYMVTTDILGLWICLISSVCHLLGCVNYHTSFVSFVSQS
jgi:hypothetical protein